MNLAKPNLVAQYQTLVALWAAFIVAGLVTFSYLLFASTSR